MNVPILVPAPRYFPRYRAPDISPVSTLFSGNLPYWRQSPGTGMVLWHGRIELRVRVRVWMSYRTLRTHITHITPRSSRYGGECRTQRTEALCRVIPWKIPGVWYTVVCSLQNDTFASIKYQLLALVSRRKRSSQLRTAV